MVMEELTVEKMIRKGILAGKRGVCSTPSPTWRFHQDDVDDDRHGRVSSNPLSVRKLGSTLWEEMKPQQPLPTSRSSNSEKVSNELLVSRMVKLEKRDALNKSLVKRLRRELRQSEAQLLRQNSARKSSEKERRARCVLERLCDEFAKGILDYDQKLKALKKKWPPSSSSSESFEDVRFILHISEAWIDARSQMGMKDEEDDSESALDRLFAEVERFVHSTTDKPQFNPPDGKGTCSLREMLMKARLEDRK